MIEESDLLKNSSMAKMLVRDGRSIKAVLSFEEMKQKLEKGLKSISVYTSYKHNMFFYTDDYCLGNGISEMLNMEFGPSSTVFRMHVHPRPGVENGIIDTLEKFELIFHNGHHRINSLEELITILNTHNQ